MQRRKKSLQMKNTKKQYKKMCNKKPSKKRRLQYDSKKTAEIK